MSNEISTKFIQTALTIYVEVNNVGKTFYTYFDEKMPVGQAWRKCEKEATDWLVDECNFQQENQSHKQCITSLSNLLSLREKLINDFPLVNDYTFLIDDYDQCLRLNFGSISVTESDKGFNIEIVSNWFTKQKIAVCKNVSESVAAAVISNSPYSRSFEDTQARPLHLTEKNIDFLEDFFSCS